MILLRLAMPRVRPCSAQRCALSGLSSTVIIIIRPQRKLFTPVFLRLSTGMVPNDQLSAARVTRRAASSRGGGPPSPPEEAKAPRWDACSRKAQRLLGIQLRLVVDILGYSGRVRERFRHRSSKFIARRPPQCRLMPRAHKNKVHL